MSFKRRHVLCLIPAALVVSLLLVLSPYEECLAQNSCRDCHKELGDALAQPVLDMDKGDIHASRNLSCADCHGGDPTSEDAEIAMSSKKGFLGKPTTAKVPEFCARCHSNPGYMRNYSVSIPTDQYEKYWGSQHGMTLKKGGTDVATCINCHGVHTIYPAKNPQSSVWPVSVPKTCDKCHGNEALMKKYGRDYSTYKDYAAGVHGQALLVKKDLGAPACNDCHGNHGAVPPGVDIVAQVCRECHASTAELFLSSPHKAAFDALKLPECVACHSNHRIERPKDQFLSVTGEGFCGKCHSADDANNGYKTAILIKAAIDSLREQQAEAASLIDAAEKKGVAVNEAKFLLKDSQDALLKSRDAIHTVNLEKVEASVKAGLNITQKVMQMGRQALDEFRFRTSGWFISTILILLLIIGIWLKIRQMEQRTNSKS
ncbi:MAG: cytochrome c3 family protein [bacterium]|nr:cytochrome c3 family protein [bacterium]